MNPITYPLILLLTALCFVSIHAEEEITLEMLFAPSHSRELRALEEPLLDSSSAESATAVYRLLLRRSFDDPISVRVILEPEKNVILTKMSSGFFGNETREFAINTAESLSSEQEQRLSQLIDSSDFWELPYQEDRLLGLDGSTWIIEGVKGANYHIVKRWSPETGPFRELGAFFLELGNVKTKEVY